MKIKLLSLSCLLVSASYAENVSVRIQSSQLDASRIISVRYFADPNSDKYISKAMNCSLKTVCLVNLEAANSAPGFHKLQIIDANQNKVISENYVENFSKNNTLSGYVININPPLSAANAPRLGAATSSGGGAAAPSSINRNLATKVNGWLKMATLACPQLKPFADLTAGFFDAYIGTPTSAQQQGMSYLTEIMSTLSNINNQIGRLQSQLSDVKYDYDKDTLDFKSTTILAALDSVSSHATELNNLLGKSNIDDYISQSGGIADLEKGNKVIDIMDKVTKGGLNEFSSTVASLGNRQNLTKLVELMNRYQNQQSRSDRKVNYIALRAYYNSEYTNFYINTLIRLREAYELQKIALFLISNDGSKYRSFFATRISFSTPGLEVNKNKSYADNLAALDKYYATLYETVNTVFDPKQLRNIYADIPFSDASRKFGQDKGWYNTKDTPNMLDINKFNAYTLMNITYYDGFNLKGSYCSYSEFNGARCGYPSHASYNNDFDIAAADWSGGIYPLTTPHIYSGRWYFMPNSFNDGRMGNGRQFVGFKAHVHGHSNNMDHEYASRTPGEIKIVTDFTLSERDYTTILVNQGSLVQHYNFFNPGNGDVINEGSNNKGRPNKAIKLTNTHLAMAQLEPRYSTNIYEFSRISPQSKLLHGYIFGLNYNIYFDNYAYEQGWFAFDVISEGAIYCVTPDCKMDDKSLRYADGTIIQIKQNGEGGPIKLEIRNK